MPMDKRNHQFLLAVCFNNKYCLFKLYINIFNNTYMTSKYYNPGNNSQSDSNEEQAVKESGKIDKKKFKVDDENYFQQEKSKMKTEKEKKKDLFQKLSSATISTLNNKDFDKAWENFQKILKEIKTSEKFIEATEFPNKFIKAFKIAQEQISSITAEQKKKLKNLKGFNYLAKELKKILPEYQTLIDNYKSQKQSSQDQESKPDNQQSQDESQRERQLQQIYKRYLDSDDPSIRRKYWLKRQKKVQKEKEEKQEEGPTPIRAQHEAKQKIFQIAQEKKKKELAISSAKQAEQQIAKIWKEFTKLSTSSKIEEYIQTLEKLNQIQSKSQSYQDFKQLSLLLVDVPIRILAISKLTKLNRYPNFPRERWNQIFNNVEKIFHKVQNSEDDDLLDKIATFEQGNDNATLGVNQKIIYRQIISSINNLERQLKKAFFYLENSQSEYSERLQDLVKFIEFLYLLSKKMAFIDGLNKQSAEVSYKVLENMHFMSKSFLEKINKSQNNLTFTELSNENTLDDYVKPVLKLNDQSITTKALLYLIYNHALNRRDKAKDLLIITDLSETIGARDYFTQVCFNRALVQLGISSFHQGNLYQTQQILSNICSMGKNREENKEKIRRFLGQNKTTDKDGGKNRILPYYLHLNIDQIEAVELIASMVLQVPFTLIQGGKITSKSFKKVAYQYERAHFIAEPLNYRDLVYAASNQLKLGNMKECIEKLSQINIWSQMGDVEEALQNLKVNIKQTALKCYILANRSSFKCISLQGLATKFGMELKAVKKIIYREINDRKMVGSITSDGYLNLTQKRKEKQSGLRSINYLIYSKLEELNKQNEEIFKQKQEAAPEEEEEFEKEAKVARRLYDAFTQKLKNIISRRG